MTPKLTKSERKAFEERETRALRKAGPRPERETRIASVTAMRYGSSGAEPSIDLLAHDVAFVRFVVVHNGEERTVDFEVEVRDGVPGVTARSPDSVLIVRPRVANTIAIQPIGSQD